MNTQQLIVLWYTGLVVVGTVLISRDWSAPAIIVATVIIGSLLIFTLREHPRANKRKVLGFVAASVGVLGIVASILLLVSSKSAEEEDGETTISADKIEIIDPQLVFNGRGGVTFTGRVRNQSAEEVRLLYLQVRLYAREPKYERLLIMGGPPARPEEVRGETPIDGQRMTWTSYPVDGIPPGETQSIEINDVVSPMRPPQEWVWTYEIAEVH